MSGKELRRLVQQLQSLKDTPTRVCIDNRRTKMLEARLLLKLADIFHKKADANRASTAMNLPCLFCVVLTILVPLVCIITFILLFTVHSGTASTVAPVLIGGVCIFVGLNIWCRWKASRSESALWDVQDIKGTCDNIMYASGLYNAALVRMAYDKSEHRQVNSNLLRLHHDFLMYICLIDEAKIAANTRLKEKIKYKSQLEEFRKRVNGWNDERLKKYFDYEADVYEECDEECAREYTREVGSLCQVIACHTRSLLRQMIHECLAVLGPAPCQFAVVGHGSLARQEATPYSDIEFTILVEDSAEKNVKYFQLLTNFLHLKILDLGETPIPSLSIPYLNDHYSLEAEDNWYYDAFTPSGFKFDGAMPWACKTPMGRKETFLKPNTCLIKTPDDMADLQLESSYNNEGYHLADCLFSSVLITGSDTLFKEYNDKVWFHLENKSAPLFENLTLGFERGMRILKEVVENVGNEWDGILPQEGATRESTDIRIKHDLYRALSLILVALRLLYGCREVSTHDFMIKLREHNEVFATEISFLLSLVVHLRITTYCDRKGQFDDISFEKVSIRYNNQKGHVTYTLPRGFLIRLYKTLPRLLAGICSNFETSLAKGRFLFPGGTALDVLPYWQSLENFILEPENGDLNLQLEHMNLMKKLLPYAALCGDMNVVRRLVSVCAEKMIESGDTRDTFPINEKDIRAFMSVHRRRLNMEQFMCIGEIILLWTFHQTATKVLDCWNPIYRRDNPDHVSVPIDADDRYVVHMRRIIGRLQRK